MTNPPTDDAQTPIRIKQKIRDLMGRATLQRVRGQPGQALQLAQEALVLDETNWEVHEFIGDMLMTLGRGSEALQSYQRARELNRNRVELEDKVARAAVSKAAHLQSLEYAQAVLEGRALQEPKRKPAHAAAFSILLPGLGQMYNGQFAKGAVLLVVSLVLFLAGMRSLAAEMTTLTVVRQSPYAALFGAAAIWLGLLLALWIYAIADAALHAAKTHTSDRTGVT